jgi:putative drug exporter of the RND superfamily
VTRPLYHLGRLCARHHWPVIGLWAVVAVVLVVVAQSAGERYSDNLSLPGTDSTNATNLLQDKLPQQAYGTNPVVLQAKSGSLTDPSNKASVGNTVASLNKVKHVIKTVDPTSSAGASFLSKDKTIGYIPVTLDVGPSDLTVEQAQAVSDGAGPARQAGLKVAVGGYVGQKLSKPATESSEAIGLAAAVVILLFAFGTATAMALPIATAVLGLAISLSAVRLLAHAFQVPSIAPTLATMIGLGVGIDYALFLVTRHKLQLREGMEMQESVARSAATAGGAVVFAGITVVIALVSLAAADIPIVTAMGCMAAISVVVAVLAATTLLPALLGALGPRIDSLRIKLGRTHPDDHRPHGWLRWAGGVAKRPWRSAVASVVVLAVLALPVLNLQLGQSDVGALPTSTTARQAYDLITKGFGVGTNGPLLISASLGSPASSANDTRLTTLENEVKKTSGVQSVTPATVDSKGDAAVFTAIPTTAPSSDDTVDLVNNLRDNVIPAALKGTDLKAYVGGQTAGYIDLADRISEKLPSMILIVVALSFLVLLLAFRSILVPLKAAIMNLLSVAAAYGVVTFVFQEGHGASLIGLDGAIPIVSFVPLLMFAILFGLSMDYEVFLLTQVHEHYREHSDPSRAVVEGLANTGRVITSAALIMVFVFGSFILNGDPTVKEFGVGLAVAIAIDATIVRCLLVPAVMVLLRGRAWWLPKWLARVVPRISIEGEEYFAKRDAERAAAAQPAAKS